jgi:archaellum component FlaC
MLENLDPKDLDKLMGALKDMSNSMLRMDAERSLQKEVRNDICEELDLNKKVFTKLARTYHKQNFSEEVELHHQFEKIYEVIQNKST